MLSAASHGTDHLIVQRLLATRSLRDARTALVGSGIVVILQFLLFLLVGSAIWAAHLAPDALPGDQIFPRFIVEHLPAGLAGLLVAGILAAAMSTISSSINALASSMTHDLYAGWTGRREPAHLLKVGRFFSAVWGIGLIAGALVFERYAAGNDTPVVVLALSVASITYGALLGTYFLAGRWPRARGQDVVAAVAVTVLSCSSSCSPAAGRPAGARLAGAYRPSRVALVRAAWHRCSRSAADRWLSYLPEPCDDSSSPSDPAVTRILIGADVGGTKTAVGVSDGERIIARAEGSGAAVRPGRALASASVIAEVVRQALAGAGRLTGDVLFVGAAGAGREPERDELRKALRAENLAAAVVVATDIEIALAAAFDEGPGIVVSAGTGSVAVGRDRSGKQHRIGGYGWQMGDEGSGYAIGRAALGAVSRAADGRSPRTALTERVLAASRSDDFDALVRWAAGASPAEVAALAPHVLDVAAARRPAGPGHRGLRRPRAHPARHLPAADDGDRARRSAWRSPAACCRPTAAPPQRARAARGGAGAQAVRRRRCDAVAGRAPDWRDGSDPHGVAERPNSLRRLPLLRRLPQPAVPHAVEEVDQQPQQQPDAEPDPGERRELEHQVEAGHDRDDRRDRHPGRAERADPVRLRAAAARSRPPTPARTRTACRCW